MEEILYIMVLWPESQMLMEEDWFDECILDQDSSADYLVPIDRYKQWKMKEELIANQDKMDTVAVSNMKSEILSCAIKILKDCRTMIESMEQHDQIPEEWENNSIIDDINEFLDMV